MSRRFTDTASAEAIIEGIKEGEYKNTLNIIALLKQIINDLPGTSVATEAEDLLDDYTWLVLIAQRTVLWLTIRGKSSHLPCMWIF